ncbi:hypothetical protein CHLRE_03g161100v5 [Chlamydomonas reinhardtii]|uniref:Uncharacterized protein n=1 Tax=Chlamydomonas reinhardtii TaxID=3055 RepID=A0A2K3DWE7_CHLRE|nr:uncharacterized protein CHLRE_03g161100v5 [Chlamydomonas reinhardtii]PNW84853.1 hypothetical protein CHLRE_03g161100v5 [Chlamydomonas reinhardtii]
MSSRRVDPKARSHLNEAAATGRRRAQVQEQSSRQRDVALRSRRLLAELSGGGVSGSGGGGGGWQVDAAALAALGPDVLTERVKVVTAALGRWAAAPAEEWQAALRQLAALLSTGSYQPADAAIAGGAVTTLGALLQQGPALLPPDTARRAAWSLELLASSGPEAAKAVGAVAPVLVSRLTAAVGTVLTAMSAGSGAAAGCSTPTSPGGAAGQAAAAAVGGGGGGGGGGCGEELLAADQLAAVLGSVAAWNPELQGAMLAAGAAEPLLQLLLATFEPAAALPASSFARLAAATATATAAAGAQGTPLVAGDAMEAEGGAAAAEAAADLPAEPPLVRCCCTGVWALGMMVRGRQKEAALLVSQPGLCAGWRRLLLSPSPHLPLLREAAWLAAFCSAGGGAEAAAAMAGGGGLLPGLLLATMRCVRQASLLNQGGDDGSDPAAAEAAQPLHQALLPLLMALSNIGAEPGTALLLLAEMQAVRPLEPFAAASATGAGGAGAGAGGSGGAAAGERAGEEAASGVGAGAGAGAGAGTGAGEVVGASGMQALVACLEGRVGHRGVVRGGAALAAGLAAGSCRAGGVAADAARGALAAAGVVAALVALLRGAALDIRKEAAAAIASLVQGAGAGVAGGAGGDSGGPGPGTVDTLRSLGVRGGPGGDEQGVVAAFLALLRSPDADAVHAGLRFVSLVLGGLRRGPQLVESLDGIDALEAVQYGTSGCRVPELQGWAEELVDLYYGEGYGEDEDEDEREG